MELKVPYGARSWPLRLPDGVRYDTFEPRRVPALAHPAAAVREALRDPIGTPALNRLVRPGERVCVVVNDITRLVHSDVFLPVLLHELNEAGIPDRDIFIVFALGIHRAQTPEEQRRIVGEEVARRVALFDHDSHANLVHMGRTSRGNEVWINRRVREADRVILTGEIIYHLIAGYSGGRKSLLPGVAGFETVTFNHSMLLDERCRCGVLDGNPAHEDMLEVARMFGPDFILNVVLTPPGELVRVFAGHFEAAHEAGCRAVDEMFRVPAEQLYEVVIAGAGGFPLDIDLRQAHKGMENAARTLQRGGTMIFFAECREGAGARSFEEWAERYSTAAEMEQALRHHFVVGGHKAWRMARLAEHARIFLISELPDHFVRRCHAWPTQDPEAVLRDLCRPGARIAHIPHAGFTLPTVVEKAAVA